MRGSHDVHKYTQYKQSWIEVYINLQFLEEKTSFTIVTSWMGDSIKHEGSHILVQVNTRLMS